MKRRFFCALIALMLAALPALAEGGLISALSTSTPAAVTSTPEPATPTPVPATPTPAPAGVEFARGSLRVTLPYGMEVLEGEALEGYEAAVQIDYPITAQTILAAMDAERGAAVLIAEAATDMDCLSAARAAAESLIGNPDHAKEREFGGNRCAYFLCAIGQQIFRLYYLSDGERLLIVSASGLRQSEAEAMLAGLRF